MFAKIENKTVHTNLKVISKFTSSTKAAVPNLGYAYFPGLEPLV